MHTPLEVIRYCEPCGCSVSVFERHHEWYVCPLHAAAPTMLMALEAVVEEVDDCLGLACDAIAEAKGE